LKVTHTFSRIVCTLKLAAEMSRKTRRVLEFLARGRAPSDELFQRLLLQFIKKGTPGFRVALPTDSLGAVFVFGATRRISTRKRINFAP